MSTKLQHRALRSQPQPQQSVEPPRFTSMIVPIDRSARSEAPLGDLELLRESAVVLATSEKASARPRWRSIAVTAVTSFLLIPILCLALFPVSILALACMPLAAALYAGSLGMRADTAPRNGSARNSSVPMSRAA